MSEHADTTQSFDALFVACQDQLYGYIASMLPQRDHADEVFQETSLKLLQNRSKYDPSRPFAPWAFSIALNEVRMFVRRNRRKGGLFTEAALAAVAEEQFRSASLIAASLGRLSDCVKQLTPEKQRLLEQCYAGTQSIKAIATDKGVQPEALYKQLERIRRVLFDCMRVEPAREDRRHD
jgi:RNA polymerase sigma-70 factor (ECF subfamily)